MSGLGIWLQAANYTLDPNLQSVLQACSKGKWPSQFKIVKNKIVTTKGNVFEISRDPMEVCNLIHDIISGQEKCPKAIQQIHILEESRRSSRIAKSAGSTVGVSDDAVYSFAKRETKRLNKDYYHQEQLLSCIFTAIMLGDINVGDFVLQNDKIISIRNINTEIPCIESSK